MSLAPGRGMLGGLVTLLERVPLHPILLAAYAVLFLYSVNVAEVLPVDAASPLAMSVMGAVAVTAASAILFRDLRRAALVATVAVVTFYGFGHLAPTLAGIGLDDRAQLVLWGILAVGTVVFAFRAQASLPRATAGLNVIGVLLVIVASATIVPYEIQRAGRNPSAPVSTVEAAASVARRPDIYFLVFDRYGSADAIDRRFDLENDLPDWLESQGFTVAAGSHANYRATDFSLAATLNMRFLDNLTAEIGPESGDRTPANKMIQDHAVGRFLKGQGYRYYQLGSWFGPTKSMAIADENIVLGVTSEFETVLRDTTIVPAVERLLGTAAETAPVEELTHLERHRDGTMFALRQLRRISTAPGPKFVFAHILLPHDPYVFRADGSPISEEEARDTPERELYAGHLAFTNAQIREIVGYLLSGSEAERPIVIIEGDEGPLACRRVDCVTNTPEYLRIRLGNLIAMYLPEVQADLPDSFTSVNTFRLVFREYFGANLPPLPDRSFTWPDNDHIYAFRDVTELIREPKTTRREPPS